MVDALTERSIKRLAPQAQPYDVKDCGSDSVKNLALRISAKGTRTWRMRFRSPTELDSAGNGKQKVRTLGNHPEVSVSDARQTARKILVEIGNGVDPSISDRPSEKGRTVRDLYERYKAVKYDDLRPATKLNYEAVFHKEILPAIGSYRVDRLQSDDLAKIWESAKKRAIKRNKKLSDQKGVPADPNAGREVEKVVYRVVKTFLNVCREQRLVDSDLLNGRKPHTSKRKAQREGESSDQDDKRWLTKPEIKTFVRNLDTTPVDSMTKDALKLLLYTGQRVNEVTGIKLNEIDLENATWVLPPHRAKNGRKNTVPLIPQATDLVADAIERYEYKRQDSGFLFPTLPRSKLNGNDPKPMVRTVLSSAISRNLDMLGFAGSPFTPHDLRRTLATTLAGEGVAPHVIERLLNHKSGTVSGVAAVYNRSELIPEVTAAMAIWARVLGNRSSAKVIQIRG